MKENRLPTARAMIPDLVSALRDLGGTANVRELELAVSQRLGLTEMQQRIAHDKSRSEFQYRLAWSRSYAKKEGLITTISRKGIWTIVSSSGDD